MSQDSTKTAGRWRRAALLWGGGGALVLLLVAVLVPRPVPVPPPATSAPPPPRVVAAPAPPSAAETVLAPLPSEEAAAPASPGAPIVAAMAALPPAAPIELPAWRRFAVAAPVPDGQPRVAVVVDDLGLDRARTERAIALAPAVTLSIMAYANDARAVAEAARAHGHEILLHVPMEPRDPHQDMGPNGLAAGLGPDEVMRRLRWDFDRIDDYVGINNHMGSRFTADGEAMAPVIAELKSRGLLFLDSRTIGDSQGAVLAQRAGVPFAERDVFLDDDPSAPAIAAQLGALAAWARRHGTAVAIGHPHDETLTALEAWIGTLPAKGLVLVPLSAIVEARSGALEASCAHCRASP